MDETEVAAPQVSPQAAPQVAPQAAPQTMLDTWFVTVYDQLRALARQRLAAERADHTLQPTALVNEIFLRLQNDGALKATNHGQFFLAAAEAMRRILIEHARARGRKKRGGGTLRRIS